MTAIRPGDSVAKWLARNPDLARKYLPDLNPAMKARLLYEFDFWGRPSQLGQTVEAQTPEAIWRYLLFIGGRGTGKSVAGAQWLRKQKKLGFSPMGMISVSSRNLRKDMFGEDGSGGLQKACPPWERPTYIESRNSIVWPDGDITHTFSAEEPKQMHGPNLIRIWADEFAFWAPEAAKQFKIINRVPGSRSFVTTSPVNSPHLRELINNKNTLTVRGRMTDNDFLGIDYMEELTADWGGTRIGREELDGELLEEEDGVYWTQPQIDYLRVSEVPCKIERVVLGVDSAVTANKRSDMTGIVVEALGSDGELYNLADLSGVHSPGDMARIILEACVRFGVHAIKVETNRGGFYIASNLQIHAQLLKMDCPRIIETNKQESKQSQAALCSHWWEKCQAHHVGRPRELEDEMTTWTPKATWSPNRIDAKALASLELKPVQRYVPGVRILKPKEGWPGQSDRREHIFPR